MMFRSILLTLLCAAPAVAQITSGCPTVATAISVAGSTTVQPIATSWGAGYKAQCAKVNVSVAGGGSSAGAKQVCAAATPAVDIGAMSRAWKSSEATAGSPAYLYSCLIGTTSIKVKQVEVAIDALSIIVPKGGLYATCIAGLTGGGLTTAQIRWMFSSLNTLDASSGLTNSDGSAATRKWSELKSTCPTTSIAIVGTDAASGTYAYFTETIFLSASSGETFRSGYVPLVVEANVPAKVASTTGAVGYCSYAKAKVNTSVISVKVKNSAGAYVAPTLATVQGGSYNPLSRKIYMNVNTLAAAKSKKLIEWGFSANGDSKTIAAGLSPLSAASKTSNLARL